MNIPKEKLILNLAFYGMGFSDVGAENNGLNQMSNEGASDKGTWSSGIFDYSDLAQKYINKDGYQKFYDQES